MLFEASVVAAESLVFFAFASVRKTTISYMMTVLVIMVY